MVAAADTLEKTDVLIRSAMAEHIAILRELGQAVPEPATSAQATMLSVPAA